MRTLKSSVRPAPSRMPRPAPSLSDQRMAGHALIKRRLRLWTQNPHCVDCGRLTDYPRGFELDHEVPLEFGGPDIEANCRIRCVWYDEAGRKQGCHEEKTKRERLVAGR